MQTYVAQAPKWLIIVIFLGYEMFTFWWTRRVQPKHKCAHLSKLSIANHLRKAQDFRYWHKADMALATIDVRFRGISGNSAEVPTFPSLTQKRHGCGVVWPRSRSYLGPKRS